MYTWAIMYINIYRCIYILRRDRLDRMFNPIRPVPICAARKNSINIAQSTGKNEGFRSLYLKYWFIIGWKSWQNNSEWPWIRTALTVLLVKTIRKCRPDWRRISASLRENFRWNFEQKTPKTIWIYGDSTLFVQIFLLYFAVLFPCFICGEMNPSSVVSRNNFRQNGLDSRWIWANLTVFYCARSVNSINIRFLNGWTDGLRCEDNDRIIFSLVVNRKAVLEIE